MSAKHLPLEELLKQLAEGWALTHNELLIEEFVDRFSQRLRAPIGKRQVGKNSLQFELDLSGIRLHGIHQVACLALGGRGEQVAATALDFWRRVDATDRLVFFLAHSTEAATLLRRQLPEFGAYACLSVNQLRELMAAPNPRAHLLELIRQQYSPRQLIPYNITQPVSSNMFFGREEELEKLLFEGDTSFALAGPGRLGKSSLGIHYHRSLARRKDARYGRAFRVDFYHCSDRTSDGIARHLAMGIDPSSRSDRVKTGEVTDFLKYQKYKHGGPLELLLDELDEVCFSEAFDELTMAARNGICRVVLCGRGNLFRAVTSEHSPLKGRVELLRLKPLDEASAQRLLLDPLRDLGLHIDQPEKVVEQVFNWTGRLPHLVQHYGKRLAHLAIGAGGVTPSQVDKIRGEFETAQIFLEQLESLTELRTRRLAAQLILSGQRHFTVPTVRQMAAQHGLALSYAETLAVCNELVINNVLTWSEDAFQIANHSLGHYVRKMRWHDGLLGVVDAGQLPLPV